MSRWQVTWEDSARDRLELPGEERFPNGEPRIKSKLSPNYEGSQMKRVCGSKYAKTSAM